MQYYTKQQLQGAGKYSGPCRVGNWSEDMEMQEAQIKDYLYKKANGELKLDQLRFRTERAMSDAELTCTADDGYLHFGDLIQVASATTGYVVSQDTEDFDPRPGEHACGMTCSATTRPNARNTFLIVKYIPTKPDVYTVDYPDTLLHYGQKIMFVSNPQVNSLPIDERGGPEPWYIRSVHASTTHHSKFSHNQEVSVTPKYNFDNVWVVHTPDLAKEKQTEGQPVPKGVPVIIEHCGTKQHLQMSDASYFTDFGEEKELSCHSAVKHHKPQALEGCEQGAPPKLVEKGKGVSNLWLLNNGTKVVQYPSAAVHKFDIKAVLKKLLFQLGKLGANGMQSLRKAFKEFDADGSGNLDIVEFRNCLRFCMVTVSDDEAEELLSYFDHDKSGSINAEEFIEGLEAVENTL